MYISKDDLDIDLVSLGKSTKGLSVGEDIYKSTLSHPKTGVSLETRIYSNGYQIQDSRIRVLVKNDKGFIEEEFEFDGFTDDKSFVDATNKFEEEIKKRISTTSSVTLPKLLTSLTRWSKSRSKSQTKWTTKKVYTSRTVFF